MKKTLLKSTNSLSPALMPKSPAEVQLVRTDPNKRISNPTRNAISLQSKAGGSSLTTGSPEIDSQLNPDLEKMKKTFATDDVFLLLPLLRQANGAAFLGPENESTIRGIEIYILGAVQAIGPKDGLETFLAIQMVALHGAAMRCLAAANATEQTDLGKEVNFKRANDLLRTFTALAETLKRHRSNGEQHCRVEHVHVHDQAHAVIGNIGQHNSQIKNVLRQRGKKENKNGKS